MITGGGTLGRNPKNRLEYVRYAVTGAQRLTGEEIVDRIPEIQQFARVVIEPKEFRADAPEELRALSLRISDQLMAPDIDGAVFIQGTNTIEETAYFLNLTVRSDKPVVIVGAQRPFSTLSSDGPLNLLNAIRVAADPGSKGKGVLVVANDEINAARDVTKTNTYRVETYQSRQLGRYGNRKGFADTPLGKYIHNILSERDPWFDKAAIIRVFEALSAGDATPYLAKYKPPTLVINGEFDNARPQGEKTARLIPGARHKVLPGGGHACMIEDPSGFDDSVIAFLKEVGLMPDIKMARR